MIGATCSVKVTGACGVCTNGVEESNVIGITTSRIRARRSTCLFLQFWWNEATESLSHRVRNATPRHESIERITQIVAGNDLPPRAKRCVKIVDATPVLQVRIAAEDRDFGNNRRTGFFNQLLMRIQDRGTAGVVEIFHVL